MRGGINCVALITFVTFAVTCNLCAQPPVTVEVKVSPKVCTVGDLILFVLTVRSDPKVQLTLPGLDAKFGKFEVKDYQVDERPPTERERLRITTVTYVLAAFELGRLEIPPVTISYLDASGRLQKVKAPKQFVTVRSVIPPGAKTTKTIRDVKPPVGLPLGWWVGLFIAPVLVLVAGSVGALWWVRRRWRQRHLVVNPVEKPLLPPYEEAMQALAALRAMSMHRLDDVKSFYSQLAHVVRRYFERQWDVHALEEPTGLLLTELMRFSCSSPPTHSPLTPETFLPMCERFFGQCDMVKFALYRPSGLEIQDCLKLAEQIVRACRPAPESVEVVDG